MRHCRLVLTGLLFTLFIASPLIAQDNLSAIFPPGEDWQVATEGSFCDALSCDAVGNVYFASLKEKPPTIYKLAPDNTKTKVIATQRSGTKIGADGKLYAVGNKAISVVDLATGMETVLTDKDVQPNDLVITKTGFIFFTETGKKQITLFNTKTKELKAADTGTVTRPNGIGLSPDQSTLLVSDAGGVNVWTFKIGSDGTLSDKKAAMTMKCPDNKPGISGGDGMTVDAAGRAYVTSAVGLQIFAPGGELLGILPKPVPASGEVSATFGGPGLSYLYIANGDKIYRRKTLTTGMPSTGSFSRP